MFAQIYGRFDDHGSFANVSRNIARQLKRRNISFSVYGVGSLTPTYTDAPFVVGFNSGAPIGIYIGYPEASPGWLTGHKRKILVTVCEANPIPGEWAAACNKATLVVVPSKFCREVFARAGVTTPILVARHGVDPVLFADPITERNDPQTIRLLHVSGAASFPQRKGTPQLLLAFQQIAKEYTNVHLYLKVHKTDGLSQAIHKLELVGRVHVLPEQMMSPLVVHKVLNWVDAVVQPSRGEGFGIVPLEARCVGVPVAATKTTGHFEHFASGVDTPIETGPSTPYATQGNEIGSCPTVSVKAVYEGLKALLDDLPGRKAATKKWSEEHGQEWLWSSVLREFTKEIKNLAADTRPIIVPGAEASLRGF